MYVCIRYKGSGGSGMVCDRSGLRFKQGPEGAAVCFLAECLHSESHQDSFFQL